MQHSVTLHCIGADAIPGEFLRASNEFSSLGDDSFARWGDLRIASVGIVFLLRVEQSIQEIAGVRTALHHVARKRRLNPKEMDPWYFPTVEEYQTVRKKTY